MFGQFWRENVSKVDCCKFQACGAHFDPSYRVGDEDHRCHINHTVDALVILIQVQTFDPYVGPLGLMGGEPARQTSEPGSNPSWDATVHPVCKTFNVMHVV